MSQPVYEPPGLRFHDQATGRWMLLVDDSHPSWGGWLCWRHPDAARARPPRE
jgi:hypothetical protein